MKSTKTLPFGTWNVGTMHIGLDSMDLSYCHIRKTAVIDKELSLQNMDIVALQETRSYCGEWLSQGEKIYVFCGMA